jgi:Fe-S-cluster containining protein
LRDGLAALGRIDPRRAARIQARTAESLARITPLFPGDAATGILNQDYEDSALFSEETEDNIGNTESCPVLDPATGTCDLYEYRPIVCRTFGPPMRTPEGNLATCELCFIHASTEEIAAAEFDPSIPSLEASENATYNAAHNLHGETIVAYALRSA